MNQCEVIPVCGGNTEDMMCPFWGPSGDDDVLCCYCKQSMPLECTSQMAMIHSMISSIETQTGLKIKLESGNQ